MATRSDVARLAGVSEATVSFVLNNTKNITPEVRERVLAAVEKLRYRPNLVARSLATRRTWHVAMVIDNLRNPHYCQMLEGAQQVAFQHGYIVSVISANRASMDTIADLVSRGVDGAIIAVADVAVSSYLIKRIPTVSGAGYSLLYEQAFDDMIACLKGHGHERIAFLSGLPIDYHDDRHHCFSTALERHGLPYDPRLVVARDDFATDERAGYEAMQALLARDAAFTAVYALNDLMAIGAARALREAGLSIPGDVSLIGCDHLTILDNYSPPLATIEVHSFEMGRVFMWQLMETIQGQPRDNTPLEAVFLPKESIAAARRIIA